MKIKKLTIIFGGTVELYLSVFKVFNEIEKTFKCVVRRNSTFRFSTKIRGNKIDFLFCMNPIKDRNYNIHKKYTQENKWKNLMPPPASKVAKSIKNTNLILFIGLCGGFKGKKNEIHIPEEVSELIFKESYIKHKEILKIKIFNKIKFKNFLSKKINGSKSRVITSNLTLTFGVIEKRSEEKLIELSEVLSNSADVVDKESYQIVKILRNKFPLGIMLMTSDLLHIKKYMLSDENFSPDKNKFNKNFVNALKVALEKLK